MALTAQFLTSIRGFLKALDGETLRDWLKVEPPLPQQYFDLAAELKKAYQDNAAIERLIEACLPEEDDVPEGQGTTWPGFAAFMKDYFEYWRDVDFNDLLGAHQLLTALTNSCATAFNNPTYGTIMLETSISLCSSLSKLTMTLNKRADLIRKLAALHAGDEERKSVIEVTAEIMQKFFITCLTDRSSPRYAQPTGKKIGVYIFANKTLKLLTMNHKSYMAAQLLTNVMAKSPPLSYYPAAQRVTYLYFLGRFHVNHTHYSRAAECFQEAYSQTPPHFQNHRRLILTYLIACNMLRGLLPSQALLQRPEAQSMAPCYAQLAQSIRTGNYVLFQHTIKQHEPWLRSKGLPLLTGLQYSLRALLWRSLARRTFLLTYVPPAGDESRRAATLELRHLETTMRYVQRRLEGYMPAPRVAPKGRQAGINSMLLKAVANSAGPGSADSTLVPPPGGPRRLPPDEGLLMGNMQVTAEHVEGVVASLIDQDFLHGYIAHSQGVFAIMGTKQKGSAVSAGWPPPSEAIAQRTAEPFVPGWVKEE
ncbi:hypothetical protein F4821DRAFT_99901 [Hypoxylon rubiginosum]|uniref:Uncharacterized protein n=1 Tax=Hypoxylon rubiginosum TaxID=110542 RepID=A0ACC0D4Y6_9PEZI|nr:hypothetical protein F4821DRAFT_99901 [Hypoxylon rubiginosum]